MRQYRREETIVAWLLVAPSMIGLSVFVLLPFADTIRRSFLNARGDTFVGFSNYRSVIQNQAFQLAAYNTGRFMLVCVPALLVISLIIALAMKGASERGQIGKTIYLMPMAIPVASIALLWTVVFHNQGLLNGILNELGLTTVDFMNSNVAFWVVIGTYLWKNIGYTMILWSAGMDSISGHLYQASSVDGASKWQQFQYITMPCLRSTAFLIGTLSLINLFKVYREAYLVAGNYPHESIYFLQHLFNNWFRDLDLGRVTAAAVLLLLVLLALIAMIQIIWKEEKDTGSSVNTWKWR